jgi:GntR family histidine utilization transcriptional repressor
LLQVNPDNESNRKGKPQVAKQYEIIKQALVQRIEQGDWRPGDAVPSENALAEQFEVSRMTARRALSELTEAGVLNRIQGRGSFVADQLPTGSLLTIRSIDDEIRERGHEHSAQVMLLETRLADDPLARSFLCSEGDELFFSRLLHFETDSRGTQRPIQLEERYVNPQQAPDYLKQDFHTITPSAYLSDVAPLMEADHWVEATLPDALTAESLQMARSEPLLKLTRQTYTHQQQNGKRHLVMVTLATLCYPGTRYRLGGHLGPADRREQ